MILYIYIYILKQLYMSCPNKCCLALLWHLLVIFGSREEAISQSLVRFWGPGGASPQLHRTPPPSRGGHFAKSQAKPPHMLSTCVLLVSWGGLLGAPPEAPALARRQFSRVPSETATHAIYIYIYIYNCVHLGSQG